MLILGRLVPHFEGSILSWGHHVIKYFHEPAPNQELILQAAERLGWPDWFDSPLPSSK